MVTIYLVKMKSSKEEQNPSVFNLIPTIVEECIPAPGLYIVVVVVFVVVVFPGISAEMFSLKIKLSTSTLQ